MSTFDSNSRNALIQGLSVQVGDLFAQMWRDSSADSKATMECLEAYKSLRRLLPKVEDDIFDRHQGYRAAYSATQRGQLV